MKVNVKELLVSAGLDKEAFYPGKHLIKKYVLAGDHKSHAFTFDWHHDTVHIELKAGTTGRLPEIKELRQYPVSFQAPTYLDLLMNAQTGLEFEEDNDNNEDDEDETSSASGKGGGKKPMMRKREDGLSAMQAFGRMAEGTVSTLGEIKKFVIMGREIAKEGYAQAFENLKTQMAQAKVMAMDLMKGVSDIIHKATPGGGLAARGDETIKYKYDAERTAPMFGGLTPT